MSPSGYIPEPPTEEQPMYKNAGGPPGKPWPAWLKWLVIIAAIGALLFFLSEANAQEPPKPAAPPPAAEKKAEPKKPVKIKEETALKIREAQVVLLQTMLAEEQLKAQTGPSCSDLVRQQNEQQQTLNQLVDKAFKDAGLDQKEWDVDVKTWEFKPKPAPKSP